MSDTNVHDTIETALTSLPPAKIVVGFSGGMDSSVLLHALAQSATARTRGLRTIHVDHGLHAQSTDWARHCADFAATVTVPLYVNEAHVVIDRSKGVEASARKARFAAFADAVNGDGAIIALAHHRDDQAETILLKLLRGAGPEGVAAMRALRRFGRGWLWRPLLALPRATLRAYAAQHALRWIDDPSNADARLDRNYLRLAVMPRIAARWSHANESLAQAAVHASAAADFIDDKAQGALDCVRGQEPTTLQCRAWLTLPEALRDAVLRRWLRTLELGEPSRHQVSEWIRQLHVAGVDRNPCIHWPGAELRRYRDLLFALPAQAAPPRGWSASFDGSDLQLPCALGVLSLSTPSELPTLRQTLHVRFRRGGERLRLHANGPTRELRDLFQQSGVPPWQRERLPLVFNSDGDLLAVADRWQSEAGKALFAPLRASVEWRRSAHVG